MIRLSILIPSYNFKPGLIKILDSFIECSTSDLDLIEIIIGDDSEKKIIAKSELSYYKKYINNLQYIHNKNKKGCVYNWNNLINIAKGDYYWLLHHDEFLINPKYALKKIIKLLNKNASIYILPIIKTKTIFVLKRFKFTIKTNQLAYKNLIRYFLNNSNYFIYINIIGSPSSLIVRNTISLRYDTSLKWLLDVDFYSKLFKITNPNKVINLSYKDLFIMSDQNFSNSISNKLKKRTNYFKYLKKRELLFIEKRKRNFLKNISIIIIWLKYKLYCLMNIKFEIILEKKSLNKNKDYE